MLAWFFAYKTFFLDTYTETRDSYFGTTTTKLYRVVTLWMHIFASFSGAFYPLKKN